MEHLPVVKELINTSEALEKEYDIIVEEPDSKLRFERVTVSYKCGCTYYNDSWKSACESDAKCLEHGQTIKSEKGEWVTGTRPLFLETITTKTQ
jgi:hypothetical protein